MWDKRLPHSMVAVILSWLSSQLSVSIPAITHAQPAAATASSFDVDDPFYFPGVLSTTYSLQGDINIGAIVLTTTNSPHYPSGACSESVEKPMHALELTEAIAFATERINRDPNLLPNVTLGFAIRGSCSSVGVSLATSMVFLPRDKSTHTDSTCPCGQFDNSTTHPYPHHHHHHDVIGLLGLGFSRVVVPISSLYAVAHLPMVGSLETSDELSDKRTHPYFFRVIGPNVYEVSAVLKFVSSNGWSYVSILYVDDAYGRNSFENVNAMAERYGVCVATSHGLIYSTDYQRVVADLLLHSRARAVLVFIFSIEFERLLEAMVDQNAAGRLILVGFIEGAWKVISNDYNYKGTNPDPRLGTFTFTNYSKYASQFHDYLQRQNVTTSKNPWMKSIWEELLSCSFASGTCSDAPDLMRSLTDQAFPDAPLYMDALMSYAHAVHHLLLERCPEARGTAARDCVTGQLLREYLKNTTFEGYLGRVEFDKNQEVLMRFVVSQVQYDHPHSPGEAEGGMILKTVAIYASSTDTIEYVTDSSISWSHLTPVERIVPWSNDSILGDEIPESVCSRPCVPGEYKIEKEVPCCWTCLRCRDNERLAEDNTSCLACPVFTWPDPDTDFTACVDIPLTYSSLPDSLPLALVSLTVTALAAYAFTVMGYVIYRDTRVIKASGRELSCLQLVAILAGYVNILLFQMKPSQGLCSAIYVLFCMSFVQLYGPLLVKTVRIFRIFQSGKTNSQQLRFISPQSQLFLSGCLILPQVALCAASFVLFPPGARRTQPLASQKLVELSCDLNLPGLTSFLGYTLVLVCLCSLVAVKVRKLPDNFNESQFIAMCVSTTLLIWLAFVPAYFTAGRQYVRVFLLSSALLLNHTVALAFLFLPKVYAAAFLTSTTTTDSAGGKS